MKIKIKLKNEKSFVNTSDGVIFNRTEIVKIRQCIFNGCGLYSAIFRIKSYENKIFNFEIFYKINEY